MAERASQLGFEFAQQAIPSVASVELAATRARTRSSKEHLQARRSAVFQASPTDAAEGCERRTDRGAAAEEGCGTSEDWPSPGSSARVARRATPGAHARSTPESAVDNERPAGSASTRDLRVAAETQRDPSPNRAHIGTGHLESALDVPEERAAHIFEVDLDLEEACAPSSDDELARALELSLRARHRDPHTPLRLNVTDNVRTMVSLRRDKARAQLEVRLHHMFLQAGPEIWSALGEYLFTGDREAARSIARYIEQHRQRIRRPERRPLTLKAAGRHHDLQAIYQAVNQRYFDGTVSVNVTWARKQAARASADRRSIKLGSYTSRDRLIRVHPALDAAFVPRYFIEYIVYHEMLHHVLPPKQHDRRRELHGPEFLARERQFHDYRVALQWERENLAKLLRRRVTRRPSVER